MVKGEQEMRRRRRGEDILHDSWDVLYYVGMGFVGMEMQ